MPVTFDPGEAPAVIRLEGAIDIGCAAELKAVLLQALAAKREALISVEAVTGMDVTAVQLLWAAEREAKVSGMVLSIEGPVPDALRAALREAGFERFPFAEDPQPVDKADEVRE